MRNVCVGGKLRQVSRLIVVDEIWRELRVAFRLGLLSRRGGPVTFASASHGGGLRLVSAGHPHHTEEKEI